MQNEYDFTKGERGKFYQADVKLNVPVYLEDEVLAFVEEIAHNKDQNLSTVVNQLLRDKIKKGSAPFIEKRALTPFSPRPVRRPALGYRSRRNR